MKKQHKSQQMSTLETLTWNLEQILQKMLLLLGIGTSYHMNLNFQTVQVVQSALGSEIMVIFPACSTGQPNLAYDDTDHEQGEEKIYDRLHMTTPASRDLGTTLRK